MSTKQSLKPNIEEIKNRARCFLKALLVSRGVTIQNNGKWNCFCHEDKQASANFVPGTDETRWHCHGCGAGGDLFDAVCQLDGKPVAGPGWFKDTFLETCKEFGVYTGSDLELSDEDAAIADAQLAYDRAAKIVLNHKKAPCVEAKLAQYGWSKRTVRIFGVGGVTSFEAYSKELMSFGYSRKYLEDLDLLDERMFSEDCLIYTLKNQYGQPIGFSARNLKYDQLSTELDGIEAALGKKSPEYQAKAQTLPTKYVHTGARCVLFRKKEFLFGLHASREHGRAMWIFEGNADCITAFDAGLINSVALCGSAFTPGHFKTLDQLGFCHLIAVFDPDAGGESATERFMAWAEKDLANRPDVQIEVVTLPKGNSKLDPDLFLRTHGLQAFRKLPRETGFHWAISRKRESGEPALLLDSVARVMLRQPDPVRRYFMTREAAEVFQVPEVVVLEKLMYEASKEDPELAGPILESTRRVKEALGIPTPPAAAVPEEEPEPWEQVATEPEPQIPVVAADGVLRATSFIPVITIPEKQEPKAPPAERAAKHAEAWV